MRKVKHKFMNFVKDKDMFGHRYSLNFDKQGDTHNTVVGGLNSIVIQLFFIGFVAMLIKRMALQESNDNVSVHGSVNLDILKPVGFLQKDNARFFVSL